jgi:hypothetical protein
VWVSEEGTESHYKVGSKRRKKKDVKGCKFRSTVLMYCFCIVYSSLSMSLIEWRGGRRNAPMTRRESLGKVCFRFQYSVIVILSLRSCMCVLFSCSVCCMKKDCGPGFLIQEETQWIYASAVGSR